MVLLGVANRGRLACGGSPYCKGALTEGGVARFAVGKGKTTCLFPLPSFPVKVVGMARKRPPPDPSLGLPGGPGTDPDAQVFGVEFRVTADGGAYVIPRSIARLSGPAEELVHHLQHLAITRQELEDAIAEAVLDGRHLGVSWSAIGWSVGTTGEAARQRWSGAPAPD